MYALGCQSNKSLVNTESLYFTIHVVTYCNLCVELSGDPQSPNKAPETGHMTEQLPKRVKNIYMHQYNNRTL